MLRDRQTERGFYDIWPGNGAGSGIFCQPRSPHRGASQFSEAELSPELSLLLRLEADAAEQCVYCSQ